jgi:hypothetical protein
MQLGSTLVDQRDHMHTECRVMREIEVAPCSLSPEPERGLAFQSTTAVHRESLIGWEDADE